jgi:hypothetical protein
MPLLKNAEIAMLVIVKLMLNIEITLKQWISSVEFLNKCSIKIYKYVTSTSIADESTLLHYRICVGLQDKF